MPGAGDRDRPLIASPAVSSVATAPERAGQADAERTTCASARSGRSLDAIVAVLVAAVLVAVAFLTSGSSDQVVTASNTWTEIVGLILGAGACAGVVLAGARGRAWGGATVALFATLTAFEGLSIAWSVQPDWSWFGSDQTLFYLAAFAGAAALARLVPERWPALVGALAIAMTALSGWALLAKVFPATLAPLNTYGRLQAPFGYWNAVGAGAAIGVPACLWAASRRDGGRLSRALSAPALTLLISVLVLSSSRSAALAAVAVSACWLAVVPGRLRTTLMLAVAALGAIPVSLWGMGHSGISADAVAPTVQDAAGHQFGLVLLVTVLIMAAVGYGAALAIDRWAPSPQIRRTVGTALVVLASLIPVAGVLALATSSRGLTGEISHAWSTLTSPHSIVLDNSSRFTQLGSSRPLYWHQGLEVGEHALLKGAGELGYGVARLRYASRYKADQAHSYLIQTFADLGLIGLALTLALLVAWLLAASRSLAGRARWRSLSAAAHAERQGLMAAALVALAFGIQSALDFTWYFPGVTIPALMCAGWLAGRGPLTAPVGRRRERPPLLTRPGAAFGLTALLAVALIGAWLMWQPLRSTQQLVASENAATNPVAFADARAAASSDPLSLEPLYRLSALYAGIGDPRSARAELIKATQLQPQNPDPWYPLGDVDYGHDNRRAALSELDLVVVMDHTPDRPLFTPRAMILELRTQLSRPAAPVRSARPHSS